MKKKVNLRLEPGQVYMVGTAELFRWLVDLVDLAVEGCNPEDREATIGVREYLEYCLEENANLEDDVDEWD